jgi:hypothetical protein
MVKVSPPRQVATRKDSLGHLTRMSVADRLIGIAELSALYASKPAPIPEPKALSEANGYRPHALKMAIIAAWFMVPNSLKFHNRRG